MQAYVTFAAFLKHLFLLVSFFFKETFVFLEW